MSTSSCVGFTAPKSLCRKRSCSSKAARLHINGSAFSHGFQSLSVCENVGMPAKQATQLTTSDLL